MISGNGGGIRLLGCVDNLIQGNYIGTSPNGLTAIPNLMFGIDNYNSIGSIIGGETSAAGNVISGNQSHGISVGPNLSGNTATKIQNNFIGVAADGVNPLPNGANGINLNSTTNDVLIGGEGKSFGNIIAYNGGEGISLADINHVAIRSNSIFSNSDSGIKYYFGNHKPNLLTQTAELSGNFININQLLILKISGDHIIDYFANETCDPSGYGEGKYYLGSKVISSPINNSQAFPEVQFAVSNRLAKYITSTVTEPNGNTSEFSQCSQVANNSSKTRFDFDGDGKADISVFRPDGGVWYLLNSTSGFTAAQFGISTDKVVPADYDGDGKTDLAFFRPSTNEWFVLRSEDSSFYSFPFGASGDIPAPGDFDGDGKADAAVFRPSSATWFIQRSSDGKTIIVNFGIPEDKPVVADYDGDGKDDIAVFRPSVSEWWINRSRDGAAAYQFGASGDKTVQGDYTGDGKADIAIFRPSNNNWLILRSENNSFFSFPFGASGDIPSPGDYDGDGIFDAAIFRKSNTTWYINGTTSGTQIVGFGLSGDVPLPNVYSVP